MHIAFRRLTYCRDILSPIFVSPRATKQLLSTVFDAVFRPPATTPPLFRFASRLHCINRMNVGKRTIVTLDCHTQCYFNLGSVLLIPTNPWVRIYFSGAVSDLIPNYQVLNSFIDISMGARKHDFPQDVSLESLRIGNCKWSCRFGSLAALSFLRGAKRGHHTWSASTVKSD